MDIYIGMQRRASFSGSQSQTVRKTCEMFHIHKNKNGLQDSVIISPGMHLGCVPDVYLPKLLFLFGSFNLYTFSQQPWKIICLKTRKHFLSKKKYIFVLQRWDRIVVKVLLLDSLMYQKTRKNISINLSFISMHRSDSKGCWISKHGNRVY